MGISIRLRPIYTAYILHLLHASWPDDELELVQANYSLKGVRAIVRDLNDGQTYILEIYPDE